MYFECSVQSSMSGMISCLLNFLDNVTKTTQSLALNHHRFTFELSIEQNRLQNEILTSNYRKNFGSTSMLRIEAFLVSGDGSRNWTKLLILFHRLILVWLQLNKLVESWHAFILSHSTAFEHAIIGTRLVFRSLNDTTNDFFEFPKMEDWSHDPSHLAENVKM